jgi:hypothetical protein
MMSKTPCHDAFMSAQAARQTAPLKSGVYKLREAERAIHRMKDTLYNIRVHLTEERIFPVGTHSLGCCLSDEIEYYLTELPIKISALVASDILPAIAALTGDGIPQSDAAAEMQSVNANANRLVRDCEAVHARLRLRVDQECGNIKEGYSAVYALLTDANGIAERALQLVEWIETRRQPAELADVLVDWERADLDKFGPAVSSNYGKAAVARMEEDKSLKQLADTWVP